MRLLLVAFLLGAVVSARSILFAIPLAGRCSVDLYSAAGAAWSEAGIDARSRRADGDRQRRAADWEL